MQQFKPEEKIYQPLYLKNKKRQPIAENQARNIFQDFLIDMDNRSQRVAKASDNCCSWIEPDDIKHQNMLIYTRLENVLEVDVKLKQSKNVMFFVLVKLISRGKQVNDEFLEYRVCDYQEDFEETVDNTLSEYKLQYSSNCFC